MKLLSCALFAVTLILSVITPVQASSVVDKNIKIEQAITQAMSTFQVPGAAVAIIKDNKVVMSKGFGVVEHGKSAQVTSDTLFGICLLYTSPSPRD